MVADCVFYSGHIGKAGYGLDYEPKTQKTVLAHRKAYYDVYGEIPKGVVVMHTCNNKTCVNPQHLKLGTQSENVLAAYDDGLQVPYQSTVSDEDVLKIYHSKESTKQLMALFGYSKETINRIRRGKTYRRITHV